MAASYAAGHPGRLTASAGNWVAVNTGSAVRQRLSSPSPATLAAIDRAVAIIDEEAAG